MAENWRPIGKIFVYGTLMRGMHNHQLLAPFVASVQVATVQGRLLHLEQEGYPVLLEGSGRVQGELVELTDETAALHILDLLEEFYGPDQPENVYERRLTAVSVSEEVVSAWVYVCAALTEERCLAEGKAVENGNWREFAAVDIIKNSTGDH